MILPGMLLVDLKVDIEPAVYEMEAEITPVEYEMDVGDIDEEIDFNLGISYHAETVDAEVYDGIYSVNPSFNGQTLPTERKFLNDDITVEPIMVSRVSNLEGGTTVYIGGQFNG